MSNNNGLFHQVIPGLFVLMWSTGFIGAKYGLPYAGPMSFLAYRFAIVLIILLVIALLMKAPWPASPREAGHAMISGFLIHGVYLGGVFSAIDGGMSAALSALIVGLQPLLTTMLSGLLLGERVKRLHLIGVALGLVGVLLVLAPRLFVGDEVPLFAYGAAVAALFGITLGTIYQKATGLAMDLRTGGMLQYLGAALPIGLAAWLVEGFEVEWTLPFIGAMIWLVVVLSIGAISLLMLIIRHGEVAKVSTLFYLVPPFTAILAYFLFDEQMSFIQIVGIGLTAFAVWISSSSHAGLIKNKKNKERGR